LVSEYGAQRACLKVYYYYYYYYYHYHHYYYYYYYYKFSVASNLSLTVPITHKTSRGYIVLCTDSSNITRKMFISRIQ